MKGRVFLLDSKRSWNHWRVGRSVVYSVSVKNKVKAMSAGRSDGRWYP